MRKLLTLLASVVAVACIIACNAPPAPPHGYQQMYVTRDGADFYEFNVVDTGVNVQAPSGNSTEANSRVVVWEISTPIERDHEICSTFPNMPWPIQEGVAVRISAPYGEAGKAIAVMPNVWGYKGTAYNVQLLDLAKPVNSGRWHPVALHQDFAEELHGNEHESRRICARVVGQTLDFKVWPAHHPEPEWGATSHTRSVTLPPGWVFPGQSGVYIGHLPPGSSITVTDIEHDVIPK